MAPPPPPPAAQQQQSLGPSDIAGLFECLKGALEPTSQKQAEAALKSLEARPGFCSCLTEIVGAMDADHSARWLACTELKNCISKNWRPRLDGSSLSTGEKDHLRQKLLSMIGQEDAKFAVQIAVIFTKVARVDYPRYWPSLIDDLLGVLSGGDMLRRRRGYLVLHHVLKELSSKRLASDQRTFAQVTSRLYDHVWEQWCTDTRSLIETLPGALASGGITPQAVGQALERWLLLLKALRRLLMFGFQSDARTMQQVPAVVQVVPAMLAALQALLPIRNRRPSQLGAMLDRGLIKLAKAVTQIQETHPWSTYHGGCLQPALELFCSLLLSDQPIAAGEAHSDLIKQGILFINGVMRNPGYRGSISAGITITSASRDQNESRAAMGKAVQAGLTSFWSGGRVLAVAARLVERYFPLTSKDIQCWRSEPEEWYHEFESASAQDSLRIAAEVLFLTLLEANRETLAPALVSMLQAVSTACPPGTSGAVGATTVQGSALLAKEAVYNAVGVGAWELHDSIDFSSWFRSALLVELADTSEAAKPVRRRSALLISKWVSKMPPGDRPAAYHALLSLLASDDAALQLAAINSLQAMVDDWEFSEAQFLEFVGSSFQLLASFLQGAAEFDSQLQAFNLMSVIIERLADEVKPYADGLLALLPAVWQEAEGQSLLRIQVLLAVQRLVSALGPESPATYHFLLPALQYATNPDAPEALNLLEDGLATWLTALRCVPTMHPGLLALYPHLTAIMERSTEHIKVGTQIMTSCVLLGGSEFLQHHGAALAGTLAGLTGSVNERGMLLLFPVYEILLQAFSVDAPGLLEPALLRLLTVVLGDKESSVVTSAAFGVFARLLIHNAPAMLHFFQRAGTLMPGAAVHTPDSVSPGDPSEALLLAYLDLWLDRFDTIGAAASRKLSALSLCVLLTLPLPALLERLDTIIPHITSVWIEVEGGPDGDTAQFSFDFYSMHSARGGGHDMGEGPVVASEDAAGESNRWRRVHEADPVSNIKLQAFMQQQMQAAAAAHGEALNVALSRLDPAVLGQFRQALGS